MKKNLIEDPATNLGISFIKNYIELLSNVSKINNFNGWKYKQVDDN